MSDEIKRWDEWFALPGVGLLKKWDVIKEEFPDDQGQVMWARIIESNRIERVLRDSKNKPQQSGAPNP